MTSAREKVSGGLAAAVIAALVLVSGGEEREPNRGSPRPPEAPEGVTCTDLAESARYLQAGRADRSKAALQTAAAEAYDALQSSGQRFGQAEQIALTLESVVQKRGIRSQAVTRLLDRARSVCGELGLWST